MPRQPTPRQPARRNPNGEGSIYQRASDGRWAGQAYVITTDGTRKRKFVYGATWEEAHTKLVELKSRSQRGIPVPDRAWKLADYLPYWLAAYVTDLKPTTARGYESAVRLHLIPALGTKRLDGLQVQHVKAFMDDFRRKCLCCTNGLDKIRPADRRCCSVGRCCQRYPSARQIQFVHAVLRNALQHAMREELVSRNVAKLVRVPSPRYKVGKGLSVDQVRKILAVSSGHRLHVLYVVAATMGLRRGELVGLRWSDVNLDEGTLRVQQTVQRVAGTLHILDAKTEDSEAVLPLPEVTWLSLMEHQERQQAERAGLAEVWEDHDLVFPSERGTPMEPTNLSRSFARLRETAGLPGVRLHDLRHTVVSLLMELGVPPHVVQAIARHADVKVTLKVYAHANLDAMRQALGKLDGRLS
ncbi:tyrosine-type recombinase/integrase [Micromonospora aurantiaca]|uniref:tyrosine-type recombinase/integrase n=1 Tax=Micromonospora aurantiaca (nom. illeg.) TaxID=47850 RepID=UPI001E414824|nr:site-specific integrase [Micromonospora aurantiaca]UFN94272.1 site-specific integrase [Micromonospora aurantiaca]